VTVLIAARCVGYTGMKEIAKRSEEKYDVPDCVEVIDWSTDVNQSHHLPVKFLNTATSVRNFYSIA